MCTVFIIFVWRYWLTLVWHLLFSSGRVGERFIVSSVLHASFCIFIALRLHFTFATHVIYPGSLEFCPKMMAKSLVLSKLYFEVVMFQDPWMFHWQIRSGQLMFRNLKTNGVNFNIPHTPTQWCDKMWQLIPCEWYNSPHYIIICWFVAKLNDQNMLRLQGCFSGLGNGFPLHKP